MVARFSLFGLILLFYLAFYILFYMNSASGSWLDPAGVILSFTIGASGAYCLFTSIVRKERLGTALYMMHALVFFSIGFIGLTKGLPVYFYVLAGGLGLLVLAFGLWMHPGVRYRVLSAVLILAAIAGVPIPGLDAVSPAPATSYSNTGSEGSMAAPNLLARPAFAGDALIRALGSSSANKALAAAPPKTTGISEEDFGELFQLPFDVPEELYTADGGNLETNPHALIQTLSRWNEAADSDATQGQFIMGAGGVAPDGKIVMVDDIEAYTLAAAREKPDVFFVPVEAYLQVRDLSKGLLVVPVSHFEQVLYFLNEPVEFWPLRNFGLFCH